MTDACQRFLFDEADIRGEVVELDSVLESACEHHQYPLPVARLLGEALAACALMRATIKLEGQLTLQVYGDDDAAISLLLVHADGDGAMRGTVRYQGEPQRGGLHQLCGNARLVITIEPEDGQRYQGVVGTEEEGLAATLETYFRDSEQLPTRFFLASDGARAAGMLLQRMPQKTSEGESPAVDPDAWERVGHLAATLSERELLETGSEELLHKLFHQETVRVFEPRELYFRCRCSAERIASILRGLEREEIDKVLDEAGVVEVRCEFCGAAFRYDRVDVEHALADSATPGSERYH
ncbi:Hsp33 family molecular chaperone HslO [Halorhodospira halochloris]|uniref:Hsp33 family molecular chaperone HslO n=1 Tax=Halorhodospira halochloris TaxID=1052 RepID=UPI001EE7CB53|nr:Hsp33 family molecular chaperone HslO [Halorhodospira halochloris]